MTQPDEWAGRLVNGIADQVKHFRQARGMSAQQLADQTAKLGFPVPRSVIANLESGRRNSFTVAELIVIAQALRVAPLLLLFPVGREENFEFLPEVDVPTWEAAKWFVGDADDPIPAIDVEAHRAYRAPVALFRDHDKGLRTLWQARGNVNLLKKRVDAGENGDTAQTLELALDNLDQAESYLRRLRDLMRSQGVNPPVLASQDSNAEGGV